MSIFVQMYKNDRCQMSHDGTKLSSPEDETQI